MGLGPYKKHFLIECALMSGAIICVLVDKGKLSLVFLFALLLSYGYTE